jgi:hypothetical protein
MRVSRYDLQGLAVAKVKDAKLLYDHRRYSNSYYLFGYGVEIGLKARIARVFAPETIPDKRFVNDIHTHELNRLLLLSGLSTTLQNARNEDDQLNAHWATVLEWSEETRYDIIDAFRAQAMHNAMLDQKSGIFGWLQNNW